MNKGSGTSRARRRARRLSVRLAAEKAVTAAAAEQVAVADPPEEEETFADAAPNTGTCADGNCGHSASMHGGKMNGGACLANGCSCDAFDDGESAKKESAVVESESFVNGAEGDTLTVTFELSDFRALDEITEDDLAQMGNFIYEVRDRELGRLASAPTRIPPGEMPGKPKPAGKPNGGATAPDLPPEHMPQERVPKKRRGPAAPSATVVPGGLLSWQATIAPEGALTDDGRAFAPGSITWRDLPLSLGSMLDTPHADTVTDSQVCGRIDNIWRDGNLLKATGVFDGGQRGQEIARMVGDGTVRGVSVDLAVNSFEVGPKADFFDEDGNWAPKEHEEGDDEKGGLLDLLFGGEDSIFVVTDGKIGAVTVCPFPAFAEASISVGDSVTAGANPAVWTISMQAGYVVTADKSKQSVSALTASAVGLAPIAPPAEWFDAPQLDELTPLTVDDEGRIYGHAAAWDVCHIGIAGGCTTAPHTATNYSYYHLKEVLCDDGSRVACGTITLAAHHAHRNLGRADAAAHYDHTGTAVADVIVGEDDFGIWVSGALRGDVSEDQARALRGAVLSGDWRDVNGNLELVALLAVNVPGFPVPRARAVVASGVPMTLLSAGIPSFDETQAPLTATQRNQFDALRMASEYAALRELANGAAS